MLSRTHLLVPRMPHQTRATVRGQRGLSLVETMVGIAVGLFVVAGTTALVGAQLGDTRRLTIETQLQQDLRAAADIMSRELRRAGHWDNAENFLLLTNGGAAAVSPYTAVTPTSATDHVTTYSYRRSSGSTGPFGFQLDNGVIRSRLINAQWQDLTDTRVMNVTSVTITPTSNVSDVLACPKACSDGTTACWPKVAVRELDITIQATSRMDSTVSRTMRSTVRLRNDWVQFNDSANPTSLCPP